jgi:hypothetical protein
MQYSTWSRRIADLAGEVSRLAAEATSLGVPSPSSTAWHADLFQKLLPQLAEAPYLIVAIAGGTNTGKSTVFNHLAGFPASRVHPDATQTRHPVCLLPHGFTHRHDLHRVFPAFELTRWTSENDAVIEGPTNRLIYREDPGEIQPPNLVLLDTPDVDGAVSVNWDRARLISHAADVLIAVLTQQKFNDAAVRRFFSEAAEADKTTLVVFNMVEWPEDQAHCPRWLETFRKGARLEPAYGYAVPRDRVAAGENRLTFHPVLAGSTEPRRDLAELRFGEIKIRSVRGALRRMLQPQGGLPSYLQELHRVSVENHEARDAICRAIQMKINAPQLPGHIVSDEIWQWLAPRRTSFDRTVHRFYGRMGSALLRLIPSHQEPAEQEARYIQAEQAQLNLSLEQIYAKLELVEATATPVVRRELAPILRGEERQRAFEELQSGLANSPLLTNTYRGYIARELEAFEAKNPMMMRAIEWGLVATAIIRPAITLCMFGGADLAAHAALHVGTHSMTQIIVDLAAGTAVTVGGEGTIASLGSPAKKLLADLFSKYYEERASLLARMVHDCVLGRHLERISRLATLAESQAYRICVTLVHDLSRNLAALGELIPPSSEIQAPSVLAESPR